MKEHVSSARPPGCWGKEPLEPFWEILMAIQGFIQASLMSGTWHWKFNLWIEFLNSVLIKFYVLSIFGLNWHSKLISLLGFFYFKLFIYNPDVKRPIFFFLGGGLYPSSTTRAPSWTCCWTYSTSRPPSPLYNIWKLNLFSKTDINKTAWINACYPNWIINQVFEQTKTKQTSITK